MVENSSRVPITKLDIQPHRKNLSNYSALIANNLIVSICSSVVLKTNTKYTAENSLISLMAFLYVIELTHYDITTDINHDIEKEMGEVDEGVKILFKIFSKVNGDLPIRPIRPELYLFKTQ